MNNARSTDVDPTDINTSTTNSHGTGLGRLHARDYNASGNNYGVTYSQPADFLGRCIDMHIDFELTALGIVYASQQWNKTACHEMGHAAGLNHRFWHLELHGPRGFPADWNRLRPT